MMKWWSLLLLNMQALARLMAPFACGKCRATASRRTCRAHRLIGSGMHFVIHFIISPSTVFLHSHMLQHSPSSEHLYFPETEMILAVPFRQLQ